MSTEEPRTEFSGSLCGQEQTHQQDPLLAAVSFLRRLGFPAAGGLGKASDSTAHVPTLPFASGKGIPYSLNNCVVKASPSLLANVKYSSWAGIF